jgi:NAD(P)-dependent dehydrogenase (short-subunit alcohol dehydrogenase family)
MQYFVTGATGFIGKRLVKALLARKGTKVHFLVRPGSEGKLAALYEFWGLNGAAKSRALPVTGDLTAKKLGVAADALKALKGQISAVYHLAAVYDLSADAESQVQVNIEGTRNMVEFAKAVDAGHVHHVSSIAAAGLYEGVFREDMFDEAEGLDHPYFMTKHESEKIVRKECKVPWTVYRPALVVGDSKTGEMDKIDGPYYFFKLIQRMRQILPPWMPSVGIEGGRINIVPVDFVVACIDHISHDRHEHRHAGKCFHLVDPKGYRVGDVLDIFSKAAHAPKMNLFVNAALLGFVPKSVKKGMMALAPVRRIRNAVMKDLGLPDDMFTFINFPTRYDRRELDAVLKGSGIECPDLRDYAWVLWDYWERHLDPDLFIDRSLKGTVAGKVVLVTGGSSGIGLAAAHKFAEAGAITVICGRDQDKLDEACAEAKAKGYSFVAYSADIADMADCDRFVQQLIADHGGVDFLINNAGRSIRRAIESSYDRFHDFERTMQLNYFGCLRVTMGLLPGMVAKKKGHVVNISSIGVLTNAPRFSAYVASKAALDAWTRCASSEFADQGVTFTTINMPLVRTPMIAPTQIYKNVPTLSPEEAADMIAQACIAKPVRIATRLGIFGEVLHALVPRVAQITMNTTFRMFPDSSAAKGDKSAKPQLSAEAVAVQALMRGIHF